MVVAPLEIPAQSRLPGAYRGLLLIQRSRGVRFGSDTPPLASQPPAGEPEKLPSAGAQLPQESQLQGPLTVPLYFIPFQPDGPVRPRRTYGGLKAAGLLLLSAVFGYGGSLVHHAFGVGQRGEKVPVVAGGAQNPGSEAFRPGLLAPQSVDSPDRQQQREKLVQSYETTVRPMQAHLNALARYVRPTLGVIETEVSDPLLARPEFKKLVPDMKIKGVGTGFIIDSEGHMLTNYHVVADKIKGAPVEEVEVRLFDGKEYTRKEKGKVLGVNEPLDLAVIKLPTGRMPALSLRQTPPKVGDMVAAFGNPAKLQGIMSTGIISGEEQVVIEGEVAGVFYPSDTMLMPGNSGGPLVDMTGQVVSVNTAIVGNRGTLGMSIPASLVLNVVPDLKAGKRVLAKDLLKDPPGMFDLFRPPSMFDVPFGMPGMPLRPFGPDSFLDPPGSLFPRPGDLLDPFGDGFRGLEPSVPPRTLPDIPLPEKSEKDKKKAP